MLRALLPMTLLLAPALAPAQQGSAVSSTVLGNRNQSLTDGSAALAAGRYEEGIRLTLAGLELPNNPADAAAAHSNLCAGFAALRRWKDALPHCNRSLELDRANWRTFNNRAAVFVGLGLLDLAVADVNAGLALDPASPTLRKSFEVVQQHKAAAMRIPGKRPTTT